MSRSNSPRAWLSAVASNSRVTKKCGTVVQLCVVRSAMSRPIELSFSSPAAVGEAAVRMARRAALALRRSAARPECRRREFRRRGRSRAAWRCRCCSPWRGGALSEKCAPGAIGRRRSRSGFRSLRGGRRRSGRRARGVRSRLRGGVARGNALAGAEQPRNGVAHGDHVAGLRFHAAENAVRLGFDFDHGLVRLDFEQDFAFGDGFSFFFAPGDELAGVLRHFECGHDDADSHGRVDDP